MTSTRVLGPVGLVAKESRVSARLRNKCKGYVLISMSQQVRALVVNEKAQQERALEMYVTLTCTISCIISGRAQRKGWQQMVR
jgi:hypothetical protein